MELFDLQHSSLGACPPFLIINANNLLMENDDVFLARTYSWGVCNVECKEHSDLALLHKLLVFHFSDSTIKLTDCHSEEFV